LNNRYQPYRSARYGAQNNQFCATRITPYSDMTTEELGKLPLAMAYVPWQYFDKMYEDLEKAYERGTVFPELDKPFLGRRCIK